MSTNSVQANMQTQQHLHATPTQGKRQPVAPNQSERSTQSISTIDTNQGNSNQLMQRSDLLAPLLSKLSKLLQAYSQDNKALSQLKPEDRTESSNFTEMTQDEGGESEEIKKNEEGNEVEESHEEEDGDKDSDSDEGEKDEMDDDDLDRDENNKDISKCSKTYYHSGVKFIKIEYFQGACPVGWDNVDE